MKDSKRWGGIIVWGQLPPIVINPRSEMSREHLSIGSIILGGNCPGAIIWVQFFLGGNCLGVNCPGERNCLGGNNPRREMSGENYLKWQLS